MSCVFKAVIACFLDAHALELGMGKMLQAMKDFDTQIFRRGDLVAKHRHILVERAMIEFFEDMAFDKGVQIRKMGDHPRRRINSPGKAHFQDIVVAVPVRIVALPENAVILFLVQMRAVEPMRGNKAVPATELDAERVSCHFSILRPAAQFPASLAPLR
jgi:hypothetical protein